MARGAPIIPTSHTRLLSGRNQWSLAGSLHPASESPQKWDSPEILTIEPLLNVLKLTSEWVRNGRERQNNYPINLVWARFHINTILKSKRLWMRYPKLNDATQILAVVESPQFPELLPLKEMNELSKIKDWLKRLQEDWAKGLVFSWIVEDRDSGKMLGQVTLSKVEGDNLWAMAFWTHPDHWGKGYATVRIPELGVHQCIILEH